MRIQFSQASLWLPSCATGSPTRAHPNYAAGLEAILTALEVLALLTPLHKASGQIRARLEKPGDRSELMTC